MSERDFAREEKLRQAVLVATEKGPATEWLARLEALAWIVGLRLAGINWNQEPEHVARDMVDLAYRQTGLEALENEPSVAAYLQTSPTT